MFSVLVFIFCENWMQKLVWYTVFVLKKNEIDYEIFKIFENGKNVFSLVFKTNFALSSLPTPFGHHPIPPLATYDH